MTLDSLTKESIDELQSFETVEPSRSVALAARVAAKRNSTQDELNDLAAALSYDAAERFDDLIKEIEKLNRKLEQIKKSG